MGSELNVALYPAFRTLLLGLESLENHYPELHNTAVSEELSKTLKHIVLETEAHYQLPNSVAMYTPTGDAAVLGVLRVFQIAVSPHYKALQQISLSERLKLLSFFDEIESEREQTLGDFIGLYQTKRILAN